jgi:2-hydroxychromene-2-carboxylate isomerase
MRLPTEGTPFPLNTVLPMRVATAADLEGRGDECCDALFKAYWERSVDVSEPSLLMKVLEQSGLPVSWLERASEQATKDALRATTDEAIARGAFGAPTLFVGDEMFWGNDRMTMVRKCLQ